ncbi:MAG: phosphohistidine phosphatase SixA [Verrucomicrobia bacterium]|nr:phosphohistidine phosphatase SixA [Verrucomicrobiota bacterium]
MESTIQQIYILRHAEAEPESSSDQLRTLTGKGVKQAKAVGRFCREHEIVPGVIISSPFIRARETAKIVASELDMADAVHTDDFLKPGMTPECALSGLERYRDETSVMLVGHEPDLSTFVGALIESRPEGVHIRKAGLIQLCVSGLKPGAGTLEFFFPVKYL